MINIERSITHMSLERYISDAFSRAIDHNIVCLDSECYYNTITLRLIDHIMARTYYDKFTQDPLFVLVVSRRDVDGVPNIPCIPWAPLESVLLRVYQREAGSLPTSKTNLCLMVGRNGELLGAY
jgi:hypothetical protein